MWYYSHISMSTAAMQYPKSTSNSLIKKGFQGLFIFLVDWKTHELKYTVFYINRRLKWKSTTLISHYENSTKVCISACTHVYVFCVLGVVTQHISQSIYLG